jgi:hypothetical protein
MPRELKYSEQNEITLFDSLSGTKIKLYYKTPTTQDRILYQSAALNILTKKNSFEEVINLQLSWAEKFITGFRKGDFTVEGKEISSDKNDSDYYPGWFGILKETASDILMNVIKTIFGESSFVIKEEPRPFVVN